ncbi:MAG: chemotaxis protein CheA [Pirellulales bacterium]
MQAISELLNDLSATFVTGEATDVDTLTSLQTKFTDLTRHLDDGAYHDAARESRNSHEQISTWFEKGARKSQSRTLWNRIERSLEKLQNLLLDDLNHRPASKTAHQEEAAAAAEVEVVSTDVVAESQAKSTESVEGGDADLDPALLAGFLSEAQEHLETAESHLLLLEENPNLQDSLSAVFRAFHTIKGVAGFLSLTHVVELAHEAENLLDLARNKTIELTGAACDLVLASIDVHKQQVGRLIEHPVVDEFASDRPRRLRLIEDIRKLAAGGPTSSSPVASAEPAPVVAEAAAPAKDESAAGAVKDAVKVDRERLDKLIDMIGELVIAESMVHQEVMTAGGSHGTHVSRNLAQLNKITRNLQQLSLSLRMVPVRGTFQKMARLVRDLSKKIGKPVDLQVAGEETELDKTIVDQIGDPMIHLIRNSVDHGLEPSSEDRVAAGKAPRGRVALRAFHQAGNILIEIEDDGRGLNRDKIIAKAKQRGLIREDQILGDEEAYNLIFQPGFSTADKLTDVSGRGVGMDVVKRNVEKLGGNVSLRSTPGRGTTVSMRLPLTLAIIDGMVVRVGGRRYVLPTLSIVELLGFDVVRHNKLYDRETTIVVRDQILPLYDVAGVLKLSTFGDSAPQQLVVVVEDQGRLAGLLVDEVIGQQQVVIKSLDGLAAQRGIAGGAVMPDGTVGIILDVHDLLDIARSS